MRSICLRGVLLEIDLVVNNVPSVDLYEFFTGLRLPLLQVSRVVHAKVRGVGE